MLLNFAALTSSQLATANTPEIGAETTVRYTDSEFLQVLSFVNTGDAVADLTQFPAGDYPLTVLPAPRHLHLRADSLCAYDSDITVVLNATMDDDAAQDIQAVMKVPDFAKTGINSCPIGMTVDFTNTDGSPLTKKVKTIVGWDELSGGRTGIRNRLSIWSSPDESDFISLGCVRNKDFGLVVPTSVPIACGYDAQKFTKQGRSEIADLTLEYAYFSYADGLSRLNGGRCALLIEAYKDELVGWERTLLTGHRPNASPSRGDGDDEVIATSTGPYESHFIFNVRA